MDSLVSVIIPVYNIEDYISKCLDSVIRQTYRNIEIIVINDGSNDGSLNICNMYSSTDNRIKLINVPNGGVSSARNIGIKDSNGDYIMFVDGDDFIAETMIEDLVKIIVSTNVDIVECNYITFYEKEELKVNDLRYSVDLFSAEEAFLDLVLNRRFKPVVWNKIYKKNLMNNMEFRVDKRNEDEFWLPNIFANCNKIAKLNKELYYYVQHLDSFMGEQYNIKRLDCLEAFYERIFIARTSFNNLEGIVIGQLIKATIYHYQKIVSSSQIVEKRKEKVRALSYINKLDDSMLSSGVRTLDLKNFIWFFLFFRFPNTVGRIRNILRIGI